MGYLTTWGWPVVLAPFAYLLTLAGLGIWPSAAIAVAAYVVLRVWYEQQRQKKPAAQVAARALPEARTRVTVRTSASSTGSNIPADSFRLSPASVSHTSKPFSPGQHGRPYEGRVAEMPQWKAGRTYRPKHSSSGAAEYDRKYPPGRHVHRGKHV